MWGTATVRGEEDVIVRRLDFDEKYCWKTDRAVEGHVMHADSDVSGFVANDWSWLERRSFYNPEGEPFWEWHSRGEPYYSLSLGALWDSWGLGPSIERQYGNEYTEDWWIFEFAFGPFHFAVQRVWNTP